MPHRVRELASRLSFRQLQVFASVYQLRSYSRAGEQLGLTQPAVSSQIRQIEQALGQPVFEYLGRRLFVTAAGERLAASVEVIFDQLRLLQDDLAALQGQVAGELKLLAVSTAQYVVPYLLQDFLRACPQVTVSVRVVNRSLAIQRLSDNSDDLVVMGIVPQGKPFASLPFLDNELLPVVAAGHALAGQSQVAAQAFLDAGLLLREPGSGSRLALELHCQQQRLRLQPQMVLGSNEAVKHAVLAGLGVAVLPRLSIAAELALGSLQRLAIDGFPLRRSWCLVHPQARQPTPVMRAFIDYVRGNIAAFADRFQASD
ncbi:MAG TPA: LysR family transcriptional regulator [Pseudomonadales bacterium]